MITYSAKDRTLNSKFKAYKLNDVSDAQMYEWIVTKEVSLKDFTLWTAAKVNDSYSEGHEDGYTNGYNNGIADGVAGDA